MKKTDNFVIDTNTIISAFILPYSTSRSAYNKAVQKGTLFISEDTFNEFKDTFVRPKFDRYLPLDIRLEIIDDFVLRAKFVRTSEKITVCRDSKDNKFLELAVAAKVTFIR